MNQEFQALLRSLSVRRLLGAILLLLATCFSKGGEPFSAGPTSPKSRVVVVQDAEATEAFRPRLERIRTMVNRAITNLTEKPTASEAWLSLVSTQDTIGLKVFSA